MPALRGRTQDIALAYARGPTQHFDKWVRRDRVSFDTDAA